MKHVVVMACLLLAKAAVAQVFPLAQHAVQPLPAMPSPGPLEVVQKKNPEQGEIFRFGVEIPYSFDAFSQGEWQELPELGGRLWQGQISSPGALSLNFIFDQYHLGPNSSLSIVGSDGAVLGPYTQADNSPAGQLGTWLLRGHTATLQLWEPAVDRGLGRLRLATVVHGVHDVFARLDGLAAGACNIDVACPQASAWQQQAQGIGIIVLGGGLCTGSMIANVAGDGTPYFLTANHCYSSSTPSWAFGFNYQRAGCGPSGGPAPSSPTVQAVSGCQVLARNASSDVMLLRLNQKPPASFGVFYNGWDRRSTAPISGASIHHPDGDLKKYSAFSSTAQRNTRSGATVWDVTWSAGVTEPGSSGAPLFGPNGLIVGQLFGGLSSCSNPTGIDWFGAFDVSWDAGSSPSNRLRDWLDPTGTNPATSPGIVGECAGGTMTLPYLQTWDQLRQAPLLNEETSPSTLATQLASGTPADPAGQVWLASPLQVTDGGTYRFRYQLGDFNTRSVDSLRVHLRLQHGLPSGWQGQVRVYATAPCTADTVLVATIAPDGSSPDLGSYPSFRPYTATFATLGHPSYQLLLQGELSLPSGPTRFFVALDTVQVQPLGSRLSPAALLPRTGPGGCAGTAVQLCYQAATQAQAVRWLLPGSATVVSTQRCPTTIYPNPGTYSITLTQYLGGDSLVQTFPNAVTIAAPATATLPETQNIEASLLNSTWTLASTGTGSWQRLPRGNRQGGTGTYALVASNFDNPNQGERNLFISPRVDLASLPQPSITWHLAHARYPGSFDSLLLAYSSDCGSTWHTLWARGGNGLATTGSTLAAFTPSPSQWQAHTVDLGHLRSLGSVQLAFINVNDFGNNIYIDDITISNGSCSAFSLVPTATSVCQGEALVLSTGSSSSGTFQWQGPGGFSATGATVVRANADTSMNGTYTVQLQLGQCLGQAYAVAVQVQPAPPTPSLQLQTSGQLQAFFSGGGLQWFENGQAMPLASPSISINNCSVYQARVSGLNGCLSPLSATFLSCISTVAGQASSTSGPSPNPAQGHTTLPHGLPSAPWHIASLLGQRLRSGQGSQVPLQGLPAGTYLLQVKLPTGTQQHRLVVQ